MYGCFAAGTATISIFAAITWYAGKIDKDNSSEETDNLALSRGIRIAVYAIIAALSSAAAVMSLVEIGDEANSEIVPVRDDEAYIYI